MTHWPQNVLFGHRGLYAITKRQRERRRLIVLLLMLIMIPVALYGLVTLFSWEATAILAGVGIVLAVRFW